MPFVPQQHQTLNLEKARNSQRSIVTVFPRQSVFTPKSPPAGVEPAPEKRAETNFGLNIMQVDSSGA